VGPSQAALVAAAALVPELAGGGERLGIGGQPRHRVGSLFRAAQEWLHQAWNVGREVSTPGVSTQPGCTAWKTTWVVL